MMQSHPNARIGEEHGAARLTEVQVQWIRAEARTAASRRRGRVNPRTGRTHAPLRGTDVFTRLATRFGVSRAAVCMAAYGDTWRHLPGALPRPSRHRGGRA